MPISMRIFGAGRWVELCLVLVLALPSLSRAQSPPEAIIQERVDQLRADGTLSVRGESISGVAVIPEFYERRGYSPAWSDPAQVQQLLRAIEDIQKDGLNPEDYHQEALQGRFTAEGSLVRPDPVEAAESDLLCTDALVRLVYTIIVGKVDAEQLDPNWNLSLDISGIDAPVFLQDIFESGSVYDAIEALKPSAPYYVRLKAALAEYRAIQRAGGWPPVGPGPALKVGMSDVRVPLLRRRLSVTGDYEGTTEGTSLEFDAPLEAAVREFQSRHRVEADGVVGDATRQALDVPVEDRIDQIRVNLERGRWVLQDLDPTFVLVNIAGFHLGFIQDGAVVHTARVQVGKPFRKTPVFRSAIKYLVFNPTWTVPPTILANDILPAVKKDPAYLSRKSIDVVDRGGKILDPTTIDWSRFTGGSIPYTLVQRPGPTNALGLVKFIFPNSYFVFLHDTPSKSLFEQDARAFSSGCIRVEDPFRLAELLLDDSASWNRQAIDRLVESRETKTVYLKKPIPVLLLYWTALVEVDGRVHFIEDVYDRDGAILRGLSSPVRPRQRDLQRRGRSGVGSHP